MAVKRTFGKEKHPTTKVPRPRAKNKAKGSNYPPKPAHIKPGANC